MVQDRRLWVSLSKLIWIQVSVILKSEKKVKNARDTDLNIIYNTQECLPNNPRNPPHIPSVHTEKIS